MKIDKLDYRGIEIETSYNKEDKTFHAYSLAGNSNAKFDSSLKNFSHGHKTEQEAIEDVKINIDKFMANTPKNYKELADELTKNLTWTGYEDCHLEQKTVEVLVSNFIKLNNK